MNSLKIVMLVLVVISTQACGLSGRKTHQKSESTVRMVSEESTNHHSAFYLKFPIRAKFMNLNDGDGIRSEMGVVDIDRLGYLKIVSVNPEEQIYFENTVKELNLMKVIKAENFTTDDGATTEKADIVRESEAFSEALQSLLLDKYGIDLEAI